MRILNGRIDGDSLEFLITFQFLKIFFINELSDHSLLWTGLRNKSNYIYSQINNNTQAKDCNLLPGKYNLESGSKEKFVEALQDSKLLIDQFLLEINNPEMDLNTLTKNLE